MTETPDYAELIERLRSHEERWECAGGGGWETPEVCIQAATALRTLLERNKELETERDQLRAKAMKVIERLASYIQSPLRMSRDEDEQNRRDVLIRAARKFLKENKQ